MKLKKKLENPWFIGSFISLFFFIIGGIFYKSKHTTLSQQNSSSNGNIQATTTGDNSPIEINDRDVNIQDSPGAIVTDSITIKEDIRRHHPPIETLKENVISSLRLLKTKYENINNRISIYSMPGNQNRQRIGRDLESFLKSAGFENANYGGIFNLYTQNIYPPILITCHPNNINFATELSSALKSFLDTKFGIKPDEKIDQYKIQITIFGEPQFRSNGSVIFDNN